MTLTDWEVFTSIVLAVGGVLVVGIKWTIKHYLAELKPNGGSSLKDAVNKMSQDVTEMRVAMARLEGRFDQHLKDGE